MLYKLGKAVWTLFLWGEKWDTPGSFKEDNDKIGLVFWKEKLAGVVKYTVGWGLPEEPLGKKLAVGQARRERSIPC